MKSYIDVVQNSVKSAGTSLLEQSTLKTAMKNGVAEEDKSQNLMIFGVEEVRRCWRADPSEKVGQVLMELGENLNLRRAGLVRNVQVGSRNPDLLRTKVSLSNSSIVQ